MVPLQYVVTRLVWLYLPEITVSKLENVLTVFVGVRELVMPFCPRLCCLQLSPL